MVNKRLIAFVIITMVMVYIAAPWFFERVMLFNEIIAFLGLLTFAVKKFKIYRSTINVVLLLLLAVSMIHAITSIFRADSLYLYLRNSVILYSMFAFFLGYYFYEYVIMYLKWFRPIIKNYLLFFLVFPVTAVFERFGMSVLFPFMFEKKSKWILPALILLTIVYAFSYESSTTLALTGFYFLLYISPNYRFFQFVIGVISLCLIIFLAYIFPFASINPALFNFQDNKAIMTVVNSHPVLQLDPNNTWRLVIWKQLMVDLFPGNIWGIGFGTPALKYFPVEDFTKVKVLPYILGGHNSFVYLFSRLGVAFIVLIWLIYSNIFREYFHYKTYYRSDNSVFFFLSFFAISVIALFNPVLESPVYASSYWLFLGLLSRVIDVRKMKISNGI